MKRLLPALRCLSIVLAIGVAGPARAESAAEQMSAAANAFLASLTPEQKTKATYEFKDDQRYDWHYIPKPRKGLPIKEMTEPQRNLAHALLKTGLSQDGYAKATTIMSLEKVLYEMENKSPKRDSELYYFTVFGKPDPKAVWGWRVEGHHLSINIAAPGAEAVAMTPSFFGSNPAEVREGPWKGTRVLAQEEDLGRQLVKSLDDAQKKTAIIAAEAPKDIVSAAERKVSRTEPAGLPATKMTAEQKALLEKLIKQYLFRHRHDLAELEWKTIETAGLDKVYFAWAGGLEPGQGQYYRVQGPDFLLEYDNTQNNANHVHTVWREFNGDFGEDLLKKHYEQSPHAKP